MRPLIYKCPRTGLSVQALIDEDLIGENTIYVPLDCPICKTSHLINPADCTNPDDDNTPDK